MQNATPAASQSSESPQESAQAQQHGHHRMIRSAVLVGALTIFSRILGLWRFRLLAGIFGATGVADAFNFAFIFPNLTRRLFGEGLLTSAFVPVFSGCLAKGEHDAANRTASILLFRLTYWLTFGCVVCVAVSAGIRMLVPNLDESTILELKLFEWMLPYCIFINVAAVLMAILNSYGHFWMPAFAPVILNVFMISACYFALPYFGTLPSQQIWALAWAVILGGIFQFLVQLPPAFARGFRFIRKVDRTDPGYQRTMENFKPVVLMVAVFQLNVMMDNVIAKHLIGETGAVTYLNMGTSVYQLPWSIFSLALGTAALPALSHLWALDKTEQFKSTLISTLRLTVYLAIPCTVGIMLLSQDIARLLYGTGRFLENDAEPVRRTGYVIMFSSLGLLFYSVNAILARALYAMKDMRTPTTTSFHSVAINLALNLFFVVACPFIVRSMDGFLAQYAPGIIHEFVHDLGNMKESGIALASTLSNAWQTWMLAKILRERINAGEGPAHARYYARFVFITAGLSAIMGITAFRYYSRSGDQEALWPFFAAIGFSVIPFFFAYRFYMYDRLVLDRKLGGKKGGAARPGFAVRLASWIPYEVNYLQEFLFGEGVEDEAMSTWSEALRLERAVLISALASAVMGFGVWAMRDSLPPEGRTMLQIIQRAVVPVFGGMLVYAMASSVFMSYEYDEFKHALWTKLSKKPA